MSGPWFQGDIAPGVPWRVTTLPTVSETGRGGAVPGRRGRADVGARPATRTPRFAVLAPGRRRLGGAVRARRARQVVPNRAAYDQPGHRRRSGAARSAISSSTPCAMPAAPGDAHGVDAVPDRAAAPCWRGRRRRRRRSTTWPRGRRLRGGGVAMSAASVRGARATGRSARAAALVATTVVFVAYPQPRADRAPAGSAAAGSGRRAVARGERPVGDAELAGGRCCRRRVTEARATSYLRQRTDQRLEKETKNKKKRQRRAACSAGRTAAAGDKLSTPPVAHSAAATSTAWVGDGLPGVRSPRSPPATARSPRSAGPACALSVAGRPRRARPRRRLLPRAGRSSADAARARRDLRPAPACSRSPPIAWGGVAACGGDRRRGEPRSPSRQRDSPSAPPALGRHRTALAFVAPRPTSPCWPRSRPRSAIGLVLGFYDHHHGAWHFVGVIELRRDPVGRRPRLRRPISTWFYPRCTGP